MILKRDVYLPRFFYIGSREAIRGRISVQSVGKGFPC